MSDLPDYIKDLIREGYINERGKPLKCHKDECNSLTQVDEVYDSEGRLIEYSLRCDYCWDIAGTWSYGNWDM